MSDREMILAALRLSADELAREVQRLPAEAALWRSAEGEWSQHECLTHLWIAEHFIFLPRLQRMAAEDRPALPVVDEAALLKQAWNPEQPRADLLAAFLADRQAEVELLEHNDWSRPGVHAALGPVDMAWVAQYALGHTWEHSSQMLRVRLRYQVRKH